MTRRTRKLVGIPVLKLPPARLGPVAVALQNHEYDRVGFKFAVLELFNGDKEEKSVFRGMAIPTLRALGLLLGFEAELRLSSDGALVAAAHVGHQLRPVARLLEQLEVDQELDVSWPSAPIEVAVVIDALVAKDRTPDTSLAEVRRRAARWLQYLEYYGIVYREAGGLRRARSSAPLFPTMTQFAPMLQDAYRHSSPKTIGEPAVPVDEVASVLVLNGLEKGWVMTRRDFDQMLRKVLDEDLVTVHLHRSMGAGQRLFRWREEAYESLSIRMANP